MKGPAIFLAQFAGDAAPFNNLASIAQWAADLGYVGVQIPTWDARLIDLKRAAESQDYCDEIAGVCAESGVAITSGLAGNERIVMTAGAFLNPGQKVIPNLQKPN